MNNFEEMKKMHDYARVLEKFIPFLQKVAVTVVKNGKPLSPNVIASNREKLEKISTDSEIEKIAFKNLTDIIDLVEKIESVNEEDKTVVINDIKNSINKVW